MLLNTDYKLIRINQTDYEIPKKVLEIAKRANDFSYGVTINVIIFNEQKNDYLLILDRIACIKNIDAPFWKNDSLQTIIIYNIAFYDTNNDGLISGQDIGEIYISKLDGKNFKKIAPDSLTVIGYEFTRDFKGIYLQCLKIEKDKSIPREHWNQVSGFYNINEQKFILDTKLNKLIEQAKKLLVS